jgi:hypothetical protein
MFDVPLSLLSGERALIAPTLGTAIALVSNDVDNVTTQTISFMSTTGDILIRLGTRNTVVTPAVVTATWNGVSVPQRVHAPVSTIIEQAHAYIFAGFGMATGTHNIVLDFHSGYRDCVAWIQDINGAADTPVGESGIGEGAVDAATLDATIDVQNAASFLVAIGVYRDGLSDPLTVSSGWTNNGERQSANGFNDVCCIFGSRAADGVGDETLTVASTGTRNALSQAIAILELLPS